MIRTTASPSLSRARAVEAAEETLTVRPQPDLQVPFGPRSGRPSQKTEADGALSVHELQALRGERTSKRALLQRAVLTLVGDGFSRGGQERFVGALAREFPTSAARENAPELAWLWRKLATLRGRNDTSTLERFFAARGVAPGSDSGFVLDRAGLASRLAKIADNGGVVTRQDERLLSAQLKDLADLSDLFYAERALRRAAATGSLANEAAARLRALIAPKLRGRVHALGLADAIRRMHRDGYAPASVAAFKRLVSACTHDADALFFAKRVALSFLAHAEAQAPSKALEAVRRELESYFATRTNGLFDRHAQVRALRKERAAGTLDGRAFEILRAAATTSKTKGEYLNAVSYARQDLGLSCAIRTAYFDAQAELFEAFSQAGFAGVRDAAGNILERDIEVVERKKREERLRKGLTT